MSCLNKTVSRTPDSVTVCLSHMAAEVLSYQMFCVAALISGAQVVFWEKNNNF